MKIQFTQSGGFAGITRACELDTMHMNASDAERLEELLHGSGLLDLKDTQSSKARDSFVFQIEVSQKGDSRSVTVDDASLPEKARPLIEYLQSQASVKKR